MSTSSSPLSESRRPISPLERLQRSFRRGATPPPRISVPDWSDRYRRLAKVEGARPGRFITATVEIARGPMLAVTEPGVRIITAMVATQLLKTTLLMSTAGFFAHLDPCPMLLVQPKEAAAEAFSKERVEPMIKETPVLRAIVGSSRTRSKDETLLFKAFPGGFLAMVGAGSPDNLARRPVRVVMYDEIDKYVTTKEGDPLALGDERLATFDLNSLSIRVCSPTEKGGSRIERSYEASDQRRASVECPHCSHRQFLDFFKHVHWPKSEDGEHQTKLAQIACERCAQTWSEGQRLKALRTIRWHQTKPYACCGARHDPLEAYERAWREESVAAAVTQIWDWWESPRYAVYRARCPGCGSWPISNEHAGFQASKLFSPSQKDKPADIAGKWIAAQGDEDALQAVYNTQLAQTYRRNTAREVKADALAARAEIFGGVVPDGVAVITVGVDTQDYRLEATAIGWGRMEESWTLEHEVFDGDPETDHSIWEKLDAWLKKIRYRADGRAFPVSAVCIDSGGHHTQRVYDFTKARLGRKVWAIKGESARNGQRNPIWPVKRPSSRTKKSFRPIILGVNAAKDVVYARLIKTALSETPGGQGYMHHSADLDAGYYAQLTAERSVTKLAPGGQKYRIWEPISGRANEAFDCLVYAYAALCGMVHMGLKLNLRADAVGAATPITAPVAAQVEAPMPMQSAPQKPTSAKERQQAASARLAARLSRMK